MIVGARCTPWTSSLPRTITYSRMHDSALSSLGSPLLLVSTQEEGTHVCSLVLLTASNVPCLETKRLGWFGVFSFDDDCAALLYPTSSHSSLLSWQSMAARAWRTATLFRFQICLNSLVHALCIDLRDNGPITNPYIHFNMLQVRAPHRSPIDLPNHYSAYHLVHVDSTRANIGGRSLFTARRTYSLPLVCVCVCVCVCACARARACLRARACVCISECDHWCV